MGGLFSVALSVTANCLPCPGVTWQRVHGARTFLGRCESTAPHRDRPASYDFLLLTQLSWLCSLEPLV